MMTLEQARAALENRIIVEAARGRRYPRKLCPVDGCGATVIVSRIMCLRCWRGLPAQVRKEHDRVYRDYRAAIDREEKIFAVRALRESCARCVMHASNG